MPDDYRDKEVAGKPAEFTVTLHWVKERELPALDDEFAQQVGEYADVAALRTAIETQLRQREEERVRDKLEEDGDEQAGRDLVDRVSAAAVEHQAQHMLETFTRNVEQQGLQLPQYLRLVGKEQDAFEQEIRTEAETRVRRSLALDAFADAEQIDVEQQEVEDEVHRPRHARRRRASSDWRLANPSDVQRVAGSHARAQGDGATARAGDRRRRCASRSEKPAERGRDVRYWRTQREADAPAAPEAEEDRGTA